jgi:hypothetical protein
MRKQHNVREWQKVRKNGNSRKMIMISQEKVRKTENVRKKESARDSEKG